MELCESIKIIPVGSLAILLGIKSLKPETCLIIKVLPKYQWNAFGLPTYLVLKKDGTLDTYTSAAIRGLSETG
jgi:hypothetical protein